MTDELRIAHLRIAHQATNPEVGNPEIHRPQWVHFSDALQSDGPNRLLSYSQCVSFLLWFCLVWVGLNLFALFSFVCLVRFEFICTFV